MNKPKIDLKARLGRRPGATPASASIPPPVGVGQSQPSPAPMPNPGGYASAGYPSTQPQQQARPSFDAMGVGAVVQAPAPMRGVATPTSFEAEEEFRAVRQGSRTKVIILAAGTAFVGGLLGFAVGGLSERNSVAETAVAGAKQLAADIDTANAAVVKLDQVLTDALKDLKDGKYPDAEVKELGGINIPFDGTNLAGKAIGRFKPQLVTMLISYAEDAARVNTQKDKIRSVLSLSKAAVEDLLAQANSPQVRWGVAVQSGPQGPWGSMQVLPAAFAVSGEKGGWPAQFELGENKTSVKRYTGGDPNNQVIPVAPQTQTAVCPSDTMVRIRRELADLQKVVKGDQTPGQETDGIAALGEAIKKQLNSIGG